MEDKEPLPFSVVIVSLVLSVFLVYSILQCVQRFVDIEKSSVFSIVFCASTLLSLIIDGFYYSHINKLIKSKIGTWIGNNYPMLTLGYIITNLLLASITNQVKWTADEVDNVLLIEWTIFGLSITMFLVWRVLIVEYLKKKIPAEPVKADSFSKYKYLIEKRSFSQEIDSTFTTVILLSLNLVLLLFSTGLAFIICLPEAILTQNVIIITFYFSTNTIALLFFDIVKPLMKNKESLKESSKVGENEINAALGGVFIETILKTGIETIQSSDELTEEQKKEGVHQFLSGMKEVFRELKEESGQGKT